MMINSFTVEPAGYGIRADQWLIVSVLLLTGLGLVTLMSASYAFAERFFDDGYYFIRRQCILGGIGLVLFFIASFIPLDFIRRWIALPVLGVALLCVLPFVPGIGMTINGASRWIYIGGQSFQPSELVKIVLPFYLAHMFDKKRDQLNASSMGIVPPALVTVLFFFLISAQNNFSTAIFIAANALVLFFLAGVRVRYFITALVIMLPLSVLSIFTKEYRVRRLLSYIHPEEDPLGAGYQVRSSILTIGSGGFWGKGLGQGTRKIASVPEIHSDFIFAAYSEEFGFIGVLLCYVLFIVFAIRGYRAAMKSGDTFKRLLACGLVTTIITQAMLNIAVVSGFLPATGIPLPFFSAGGSSLAITLAAVGLIVNVSRSAAAPKETGVMYV